VLIKSSVVFLNPCTVMVSDSQSLFAVYLGMGTCDTPALTANAPNQPLFKQIKLGTKNK